jgi:hypothetical protein
MCLFQITLALDSYGDWQLRPMEWRTQKRDGFGHVNLRRGIGDGLSRKCAYGRWRFVRATTAKRCQNDDSGKACNDREQYDSVHASHSTILLCEG